MKCPKCDYIGFEATDRCRNCGYEFALAAAAPPPAADLPMRSTEDERLTTDLSLHDTGSDTRRKSGRPIDLDRLIGVPETPPDLPLFEAEEGSPDPPLVAAPAVPRRPLSVRRAGAETPPPRAKRPREEPAPAPAALALPLAESPRAIAAPSVSAAAPRRRAMPIEEVPAEPFTRLMAALLDLGLLLAIDLVTLHYTLRLCDLSWPEWTSLPLLPLFGFFLLLNGGYLMAFTTAGGQTIGKMTFGLRVVGDQDEAVAPLTAAVRAALCMASVLTLGAGFAPVFAGGRAIEDRFAATRVVKLAA
jgi:uncharacterized RDD family membrane protein YckC